MAVGSRVITAVYSGDTNHQASTGTLSGGQTVNQDTSSTSVNFEQEPLNLRRFSNVHRDCSPVRRTSGTPTGSVQFEVDGVNLGSAVTLSSGSATSPATSSMAAGSRVITAVYSGDTNHQVSTGTLSGGQTVNQDTSSTSINSSKNPSTYGDSVTFTATVAPTSGTSGTPTGTVQFKVDGANLGSAVTLGSGSATSPATSSMAVGSRVITAVYSGDANHQASTGTLGGGQTVNAAAVTVTVDSGQHKVYGAADPTFTYSHHQRSAGKWQDTFSGSLSRAAGEGVGPMQLPRERWHCLATTR